MESVWRALILLVAVQKEIVVGSEGGWSISTEDAGDIYHGNETPWATQISGSESEYRNVFSADRIRWTPTRSRFQAVRRPELEDELPLQEHQRQLSRAALRPGTQLENLGGGILMDDEDDERDDEEIYPPPRKPSAQRPQNVNSGKGYPFTDLKSLLKASGPSSLSEVLQQKNLSLEDFLRGSRNALSAITSSLDKQTENLQQRVRTSAMRAPLIRRRPSTTSTTTAIPPRTVQHTTTTQNPTSSGDPSRDILELIWQEDNGPSLAEILSSRNMTIEDLIQQKQRAAGREDITELFRDEGKKRGDEARNFAQFGILETDWNQNVHRETELSDQEGTQSRTMYHVVASADRPVAPRAVEKKISLQKLLTSSEKTYKMEVTTIQSTTTEVPKKSATEENKPSIPRSKALNDVEEARIAEEYLSEDIFEGYRPITRRRLTASLKNNDEIGEKTQDSINSKTLPTSHSKIGANVETELHKGLPMGVKRAIIASGCLLGIAMLIFLGIFITFRYRQWKRRGGASPYFCEAMLEAASGENQDKGLTKLKKASSMGGGWTDSIDSAQARLWRTLRRGTSHFYHREEGQM